MKLVEIKDVRVGQIWEAHNNLFVIETAESYINKKYQFARVAMYERGQKVCFGKKQAPDYFEDKKLIGFIGITHELKEEKLVEIPQEDLIVNDVVEYLDFDGFKVTAVICAVITGYTAENTQFAFITEDGQSDDTTLFENEEIGEDSGIFTYTPQKIGILGVTHEFINERLAK